MNTQLIRLRTLVLSDLDPAYFRLTEKQVADWLKEVPKIQASIFTAVQEEVLGTLDNSLVERHLNQLQYDCTYLLNALCRYDVPDERGRELYQAVELCLQAILTNLEARYVRFFKLEENAAKAVAHEDYRIRVLLSAEALVYFFKLLYKAGALDAGPLSRVVVAIARNFTTKGVGNGHLSAGSLMTKYKQVVQRTAIAVRVLLVKMLKILDEEFTFQ